MLYENLPFLKKIKDISMSVYPSFGGSVEEIDKIINNDKDKVVVVGGVYTNLCVTEIAKDIISRNKRIRVTIGNNISLMSLAPSVDGFEKIEKVTIK